MYDISLLKSKKILIDELSKEINDKKVLNAISKVPREMFVSKEFRNLAYINSPLEIGYGQTISQPYIVALMTELLDLENSDIVLDIGTGSGYQAAILSLLSKKVITIENIKELHNKAKELFSKMKYKNIIPIYGNGIYGCPKYAPYDKIVCAAAYHKIPTPWIKQLKDNGIIVMRLEIDNSQILIKEIKNKERLDITYHSFVKFVPLINNYQNTV